MISPELETASLELLNPACRIYLPKIYSLRRPGRIFRQTFYMGTSGVYNAGPIRPIRFNLGHCELYMREGFRIVDLGMETAVVAELEANEALISVKMATCSGVGLKLEAEGLNPLFCLAHFSVYPYHPTRDLIELLRERGEYRLSSLAITTPSWGQRNTEKLMRWVNQTQGCKVPAITDYRDTKGGGMIAARDGGTILKDHSHLRPYMPKKRWSW